YAEIEQVAQAASPGPWSPDEDGYEVLAADGITVAEGFALSGPQLRATVDHIALNDPVYVLADIAAKRQIVAIHIPYQSPHNPEQLAEMVENPEDIRVESLCGVCEDLWPCQTLRLLAAPFAP